MFGIFHSFFADFQRLFLISAQKAYFIALFSYYFGTPRALPSIPEPGFQQFHTSSRPRRYCQKTQPPDSVKDFSKECLWHSHLFP
jgi:hypothetical protein